jgi:predicted HicB family RNase H-like nuclease
MNTVTYHGYIARIEPDLDDGILVGRVINTRDIIGFHGETISEAIFITV